MKLGFIFAGLLLGGGLVLAGAAPAPGDGLDELVRNSPFLPRDGSAATIPNLQLEFRGVDISPSGVMIGLYDRASGIGYWLPAPVPGHPAPAAAPGEIAVREFDPQNSRLRVAADGRDYTLILAPAKIGIAPPTDFTSDLLPEVSPNREAPQIAAEVPRRRSLRQVELVNEVLRASGSDEQLLGNPTDPE